MDIHGSWLHRLAPPPPRHAHASMKAATSPPRGASRAAVADAFDLRNRHADTRHQSGAAPKGGIL